MNMAMDQKFVDEVLAEAPHLEQALGEIMAHEHLFDDLDAGYDDDGEACLWVESALPYPGRVPAGTNPGRGWSAAVYADQAEVRHFGKTPSGLDMILTAERMPLGELLDLLNRADWELGCRAGIFNKGKEGS
jgi:hypothetical protein